MNDPYFQELFAERIGGAQYGKSTAIYKFEKIKRAKRSAKEQFPDRELLDFGIGENDEMASVGVREALKREVDRVENRGYADNGIQEYKDAAARFMKRILGVTVDPAREINHCIGTKPAYAMIPGLFINPGDVTLMTVPGYPVAGTHTRYFGGAVHALPLREENNFLPDLSSIPDDVTKRAKLLVINYPNSPTGALAEPAFFKEVVEFAHANKLVVVHDAAHILLTYGRNPFSFLSIDGAKEVGIEIHSMSKGFNMIGWRLGFVVGNPLIVQAFGDFKDNSDSGQFMAIQRAAVEALDDDSIHEGIRSKYERRMNKLVTTLRDCGAPVRMSGGSYFLYVKAPKGAAETTFSTAEDASQFLITKQSIVTVPWDDAGAFLRFSATYLAKDEREEDRLMEVLRERLQESQVRW